MRKVAIAVLTLLSTFWMSALQAEEFVEGKHYRLLEKPISVVMDKGKEVAVWEYFSYLCGHCFTFEGPVTDWASKQTAEVQFEQVPAVFNSSMLPGAQTYFALQLMGVDKDHRVSQGVYDSIHLGKEPAKSLSQYTKIVSKYGVDAASFEKMANSFAVNVKVNQAKSATINARLEGTPSMLVAGKYMVIANNYVPGHQAVLAVVDYLVAKELAK